MGGNINNSQTIEITELEQKNKSKGKNPNSGMLGGRKIQPLKTTCNMKNLILHTPRHSAITDSQENDFKPAQKC